MCDTRGERRTKLVRRQQYNKNDVKNTICSVDAWWCIPTGREREKQYTAVRYEEKLYSKNKPYAYETCTTLCVYKIYFVKYAIDRYTSTMNNCRATKPNNSSRYTLYYYNMHVWYGRRTSILLLLLLVLDPVTGRNQYFGAAHAQ